MSKKQTYGIIAGQYFIEMQMSVAQISKRLNISEKTLFEWKKEGEWDKKRSRFLKTQYSTNQTLYELLNLVSKKALEDFYKDGTMPDQKTLYFIMNMAGKLKDLKAFEAKTVEEKIDEISQDNPNNKNSEKENISKEALQRVFEALVNG